MTDTEPLPNRGYLCTGCWRRLPELTLYVVRAPVGRDFRCEECLAGQTVLFKPGEYQRAEAETKARTKAARAQPSGL